MVFNATFNNISVLSWRLVSLVEDTGEPGENHRSVANYWQTLSHVEINIENTEGVIKNEQSRETGNIGYTRRRKKTKQKHNTICVWHHSTKTNTNNV